MRKNTLIIIVVLVLSFLFYGFAVCDKDKTDKIKEKESIVAPDALTTYAEWDRCKRGEAPATFRVIWKVKIETISTFGGLYAKGHIQGNRSCTVQLRWDTDSEFYTKRIPAITDGDVVIIRGAFWGISENNDVIITVGQMELIK